MRHLSALLLFAMVPVVASQAATLEKLTLDEMIQQSTDIVRGKVVGARVAERGPVVYTYWKIQITGRWKGEPAAIMEVVTPGGAMNGMRQVFPGAPTLAEGTEYVLFLWTGKSKLTHVIGLTQGLFDLKLDGAGVAMLSRPASTEVMIDPKTAREVDDEAVRMKLSDLNGRIRRVLETARQ